MIKWFRRTMLYKWWEAYSEVNRLQVQGVFKLDRDPFALMPAIDAYATEAISGGKMRECIRRWIAGADFSDPHERDWERPS